MKICNLSFGKIVILSENLAEVIVDEGIVFDELMVDEYHDFLLNTFSSDFSLIVNKKNSYTYTFAAQKRIANLKELRAIAVVVYSTAGVMSTETLIIVNGNFKSRIKMFEDRNQALSWVKKEMLV